MPRRSKVYAALALAIFAFLTTYGWGESDPNRLIFSEAIRTSVFVAVMVYVVLTGFEWIIDQWRK